MCHWYQAGGHQDCPRDPGDRTNLAGHTSISVMKQKKYQIVLITYFLFIAGASFIAGVVVLVNPSEAKNQLFFGLSLSRMVAGAFPLGIAVLFTRLGIKSILQSSARASSNWQQLFGSNIHPLILISSCMGIFLGYLALFLPAYRLGFLSGYFHQAQPILIWLGAIGCLTLLLTLLSRGKTRYATVLIREKRVLLTTAFVLLIISLIWLFVAITGIGLKFPERFWFGAGVPVLAMQILVSVGVGILIWRYLHRVFCFARKIPRTLSFL